MTLKEKIDQDIKTAMKAREMDKLDALRAVKAAVLLAETDKGSTGHLNDEQELKLLQKQIKQRKEAAQIYLDKNRNDLADIELKQAAWIEAYLPEMLDEEKLKKEIQSLILELGINDAKDFGKIMGAASRKFAGKADNKMVSEIIRQLLA
jgi:uncharacterized protein